MNDRHDIHPVSEAEFQRATSEYREAWENAIARRDTQTLAKLNVRFMRYPDEAVAFATEEVDDEPYHLVFYNGLVDGEVVGFLRANDLDGNPCGPPVDSGNPCPPFCD